MIRGGVLALDIATMTGWAAATAEAVAAWPLVPMAWRGQPFAGISTGRMSFSGPSLGHKLDAALTGFESLIMTHRPGTVMFEAPMTPAKRSAATARLLLCLAGMAELAAFRHGVAVYEESVQTVRSHFCGKGMGHAGKDPVVAECERRGWPTGSSDICDALALLDHSIIKLRT